MADLLGRFEVHRLPNGGTVYYDPGPHRYYAELNAKPDGTYAYKRGSGLTGISTISKAIDSDPGGLLHWATKLDQEGIAELACRSADNGGDLGWLRTRESIDAALRENELTWRHVRDRAAERGTNVHERIFAALAISDRPPSLAELSDTERAYGQAAFAWWRDHEPEPIHVEQVTASLEDGIAGRFDLLCEIDGERVLVEAKTREKGEARKADHVQLAGYELCNRVCGLGVSDRRLVLLLKPDGTYEQRTGVATEDDFIRALAVHRAGQGLAGRMKAAA